MPDVAEQGQRWKSYAPIMHVDAAHIKTLIGIVVLRDTRDTFPKDQETLVKPPQNLNLKPATHECRG